MKLFFIRHNQNPLLHHLHRPHHHRHHYLMLLIEQRHLVQLHLLPRHQLQHTLLHYSCSSFLSSSNRFVTFEEKLFYLLITKIFRYVAERQQ